MLSLLLAQATDTYDYGTSAADSAATAAALGTATAGAGLAIGMMIFWFIVGIASLALFIWALIDILKREFPNQNDKILWLVLIIVLGGIGPLLYLLIGRKKGNIIGGSKPTA